MGFPDSSVGKESACSAGDLGLIPGSGRSARKGIGYPLKYSGLENSMDCIVHGVTMSQTPLSNFNFNVGFEVKVSQSCPTLCNPMDYSPSGSSVNEILQARIQEWVAISFSRVSSQPRN